MSNPIPHPVETHVRHAIGTLQAMQEALSQGANLDKQFGGDGRYIADAIQNRYGSYDNLVASRNEALGVIRQFRLLAESNGVDGHATLANWGYDPKMAALRLSDSVMEWLPARE